MKKDGFSTDTWVDPTGHSGDLAVQFDRETGSLKLVRKGKAASGRGCMLLFWSMVALVGGVLLAALAWDSRELWFWATDASPPFFLF